MDGYGFGPLLRANLGDPAMLMSSGKRHDPIKRGTMQMTRTCREQLANGETLDLDLDSASVTLAHHGSIHFRSNAGTVNVQADATRLWRAVVELVRDCKHEWSAERQVVILQALQDISADLPDVIAKLEERMAKA